MEETHASGLIRDGGRVSGVRVKHSGDTVSRDYPALVTIDATGRTRSLARLLEQDGAGIKKRPKPTLVAFKVHLENAHPENGSCEIYFYKGGYGGLSSVEGGLSNLCFIVAAKDVRRWSSDPDRVLKEVVMKNPRAAQTLGAARVRTNWLSVSLEGFGRRTPVPAPGLITIGDAASFIDPFTGSGMLMALESGQVAAEAVLQHLPALRQNSFEGLTKQYTADYFTRFNSRLRVSGLLRRAAFKPEFAEAALLLSGASSTLRRKLARSTRQSSPAKEPPLAGPKAN